MATVTSSKRHLQLTSDTYESNGIVTIGGDNLYFDGSNTYLRSDNVFSFLTDGGSAQTGQFKSLRLSTAYSGGTIPDNGILFGADTNLYRESANTLKTDDNFNIAGNLSLQGDSRILNIAGGSTTNSQSRLIIGEQGTYGVSFRWSSGSELEFDGFWNSSVTGTRNRDLGSIDVNNRIWYLNNNVTVGGTLTTPNLIIGSGNKIQFANNDYIRFDDANGVGRFHFDADGGTNNASVQAATFVGALSTTGISGNNYNITGVNQLEINDPGEGIIWKGGSSGDITLAVVDDSNDNILRLSGTGAQLQIGTNRVLTTADEGSGNGLDADTVDSLQASQFVRSDTSDTMTGNLSLHGNLLLTGTATTTNQARMIDFTGFDKEGTTDFTDRAYIQHTTNTGGHAGSVLVISSQNDSGDGIAFLTNASSQLKHNSNIILTSGNYSTTLGSIYAAASHTHAAGDITSGTFAAARMSATTRYNIGNTNGNTSSSRDKLRLYNDSNYTIGFQSGVSYGHINSDWAMTFQMNNDADRGWWFGDTGHSTSQGAAVITTEGKMVLAKSLSIGEGETVTSPSSTPLYLYGSGSTVLDIQGSQGQLFSITDDLTGDLFSVSDISGIPILNVNASGDSYFDGNLDISGSLNVTGSAFFNGNITNTPAETPGVHIGVSAGNDGQVQIMGSSAHIDFANAASEDYDMRIILQSNDELGISGGNLDLNGNHIVGVNDLYVGDQIIHDGDTNTYMQFHAADQWRVVTGGSERLEVNNSATTLQNKLVLNSVGATTTGTTGLILDGGEVKSRALGSNAFNSTAFLDAHPDTSTLSGTYGSTSNGTKIDQITVDANGHITAITTGGTGDINGVTAGTGLSGGGTSGTPTLNSVYLPAVDDRDVKPTATGIVSSVKGIKPFFTTFNGMTGTQGGSYLDMLALDTYSDSSAGGPNAITFHKDASEGDPKMYIWKAAWNGTTWGAGKRVFADNYHPNADKWTTARTLTLSGDVTGTVTFDGSGAINMTNTAVADNSHDHNYLREISTSNLNSAWQTRGTGEDGGLQLFRYQSGATGQPVGGNNANWLMNIYSHAGSGGNYPYGRQFAGTDNDDFYTRQVSNGSFSNWRKIFHTGNFTDNSSNWNTAYGWGNHAGLYAAASHNHDDRYYTESESNTRYLRRNDGNNVDIRLDSSDGRGLRFWDSNNYKIYMSSTSNGTWGGRVGNETTSDYNMYFRMSGGTNRGFVFRNGTNNMAGIDASGNGRFEGDVIAYSSSDRRYKDNLLVIGNATDKIKQLSGYEFTWNDKQTTYKEGTKDVGVVAQEVEKILPEVVTTRQDGYKAVKYEKIVPLLIEGIKEQQKQIDELKAIVNKLQNEK